MFPILFTFIALDWWTNNNKKEVNNLVTNENDNQISFGGMKYQNFKMSDNLIKLKLQIEESNVIKEFRRQHKDIKGLKVTDLV